MRNSLRVALPLSAAAVFLALGVPSASAASTTVSGTIGCINSASPVGVWIQAKTSKSGWAQTKVPVRLGGHSKVDYSFTLDKGGDYQVHVGCGGTPQKWAKSLKSKDVSGTKNDFLCNDMDRLSVAAFNALVGRMFGRPDLTQGVPYGECKHIR
ncbi:hypothetical protein [Nocardia implantans]|uniref:Uncharacterized protein n=1 Tax=Nocardia implantans TaxID=3108168 RepID=A0ABU6AQD6_9NOCA|nr:MULTISPECIES: hypothetical protein [unclassified Nocardia]MBF6189949.1 hypothetical protein [Nocardia beijingensis]MEA3526818.1 hypothetical protein [Nocardia sp. CDC192]MEB3509605.1 hypothetical protein [Nocardia sp. CDC186]